MNRDYVQHLIANSSIEELLEFYKIRSAFGKETMAFFERELTDNLNYVSVRHGLSRKFGSFRELVEYVEGFRKLSVIDGFVCVLEGETVPYSLNDWNSLIITNGLKGGKVVTLRGPNRNLEEDDVDLNGSVPETRILPVRFESFYEDISQDLEKYGSVVYLQGETVFSFRRTEMRLLFCKKQKQRRYAVWATTWGYGTRKVFFHLNWQSYRKLDQERRTLMIWELIRKYVYWHEAKNIRP
jgi:hypothetical protein